MALLKGLILVLLQALVVSSLTTFMDCHLNDRWWQLVNRRCCSDAELPKGCECFDISGDSDFTNTLFQKPKCPKDLGVKFHLFTRSNRAQSVVVKSNDGSLSASPYNPSLPTKFITHGFTDSGPAPWSLQMMNALLDEGDMNVIIVNWKDGAKGPNYYRATANVRPVGAMMAQLFRVMKTKHGASLSNIHLIGHSLGAHVSGSAGKEIRRLESQLIGRISGLDPAGPRFESYSANVRLDAFDASFVDVIHTDAEPLISSGFGTRYTIGDVDFWPNGGKHQPGCPAESGGILSMLDFEAEQGGGACSHARVVDYYTHSIHDCAFQSPSGGAGCVMGYHASPSCTGDHSPTTTATSPFC